MESKITFFLLCWLFSLSSVNCLHSNLTQLNQASLNITQGFQLIESVVSSTSLYVVTANTTHFQLAKCNWPASFNCYDWSPQFQSFIDLTTTHQQNPSIMYFQNYNVVIRYYLNQTSNPIIIYVAYGDLITYTQTTRNQKFIGKYISVYKAFYYKNQQGDEYILQGFLTGSENQLYVSNNSLPASSINDYMVESSVNGRYMVTGDRPNGIVKITVINYGYTYPSYYYYAASTSIMYNIGGTINSICFHLEYKVFIHSTDGCLYRIDLPSSTPICYNIPASQTSTECFYDSQTQSIMLINDNIGGEITIQQVHLPTNYTYLHTINATNVLFSNSYIIYFGNIQVLSSYSTSSCGTVYDPTSYTCPTCPTICTNCSNRYYCTQCPTEDYIISSPSSSYSVLTRVCSICPSNCKICNTTYVCAECYPGYQLNTNSLCILIVIPDEVAEVTTVEALAVVLGNITSFVTNSIPSARNILKPVLFVLISFDDFFPYMYHQRNYGINFVGLFSSIHEAQTEKWSTYDDFLVNPIMSKIGMDRDNFTKTYDVYYNYSSPTFIKWEGNGQSVLISAFSFLTTNFFLSLFLFIIFKVLFNIFFRFRISLLFRPYAFVPFLIFFVMEGNLQIITFYTCSILRLCFFFNPKGKIQSAIIFFGLYFLVLFSVAGYFLVFQKFKNLSRYFADNVTPSFRTTAFLTIQYGIKNLLLAMIHSLFRSQSMYTVQFASLAAVEIMCLINYIFFLKERGYFQFKTKVWIMFLFSLLKLSLLLALYFQQSNLGEPSVLEQLDIVIGQILVLYLGLIYVNVIISLGFFVVQGSKFIKQCIVDPRGLNSKKKTQKIQIIQIPVEKQKTRLEQQYDIMKAYFGPRAITVKKTKDKKGGNLLTIQKVSQLREKVHLQ